jgi:transposase
MKARAGRKPKTDAINIDELKEWISKDVNRMSGVKCQALISLKNNVSVNDVCKVLGVTRESIRLWRKTIETEGPEGFVSHPRTGRTSGLTEEVKALLKPALTKKPEELGYNQAIWDGKLVCAFLLEEKGLAISVRTAQNWLKAIGFTRQKPRKKYKQADETEIESFKKNPTRRKTTKRQ